MRPISSLLPPADHTNQRNIANPIPWCGDHRAPVPFTGDINFGGVRDSPGPEFPREIPNNSTFGRGIVPSSMNHDSLSHMRKRK
jgi:hypothetical protein